MLFRSINAINRTKVRSDEFKARVSAQWKGVKRGEQSPIHKERNAAAKKGNTFRRGAKHTPESIEKMKGHMRQNGELNSQFGTCWVTDGNLNKKIKVIDLEYWMGQGFYKGRRIIKTTQI